MALQYSTAHRTAVVADISSKVGTTGNLILYAGGGSTPANCAAADVGTQLVNLPYGSTTFGTTANGVLTANGWNTGNVTGTGTNTANYFRLCTTTTSGSGANCVVQGTVNTTGADLNLNSTSLVNGETVSVTSFTITAYGA